MHADSCHLPFAICHRSVATLAIVALVSFAACTQPPPPSPNYREYAYVTNGKSDSVSVIDLRTFRVAATLTVGRGPTGVASSPTKNEIYVANTDSNNVSVIDAEKNAVVATIGVHRAPGFVDVSRDGRRAYVANSGSANVSVIDLDQRKVMATIGVGGQPWLARVSPDGKTLAVSNTAGDSVSLIDTDKLAVRATVPVCKEPRDIAIALLGEVEKAFVACTGSNQVAAVDLKQAKLLALLDVGKRPEHLTLKPDGGELFVSNRESNNVSIIETTTNEVGSTFMVGNGPADVVITGDNTTAYVAGAGSGSVSVYAIDAGRLICATRTALPNSRSMCELPTGRDPEALALSPNQNFLLVVDRQDGAVSVIRTAPLPGGSKISADRAVVTIIPIGLEPRQIAVKAFVANPKK